MCIWDRLRFDAASCPAETWSKVKFYLAFLSQTSSRLISTYSVGFSCQVEALLSKIDAKTAHCVGEEVIARNMIVHVPLLLRPGCRLSLRPALSLPAF